MIITADTKVHELVEAYPYLLDWLAEYAPEFAKLKNPVLYNTVARVATLQAAAAMADKHPEAFLDDIRTQVAMHQITAEEAAGVTAPVDVALRAQRQEQLKAIIGKLHDGADVSAVKAEFDALATGVDAAEIAAMEQALIAEGMPVEEVMRLCDVHVTVFKESLDDGTLADVAEGHPVDVYRKENQVASEIVAELRVALDALSKAADNQQLASALEAVSLGLTNLSGLDTHYTRKENQLFPVLERHEVEGPTKVMWGLDDDIRGRLKTARALAAAGDLTSLSATLPDTLTMIDDMIYKEEKILFPTALQVVTDAEWTQIAAGDAEIGFAWDVTGRIGTASAPASSPAPAAAVAPPMADGGPLLLPLPTGALSLEQLDVMFRVLPFDLSFVDENDKVRFYSEGERVFPRSPGAIGRDVHNCHPPASVHKVIEILDSFKTGEKDVAEFWIEMGPRFIHIRYFAMRDSAGAYKGCLEVVQDATHIRSLEGQRRLVNW